MNYSGASASPLVIPAGQTSATITGALLDDGKFSTTAKTLTLTLDANPTNAVLGSTLSDNITINEADPKPTVSFASAAQTVSENGGTFSVIVTLSAASNAVSFNDSAPTETAALSIHYTLPSASPLVIPAGQTSATITGTLLDDGKFST